MHKILIALALASGCAYVASDAAEPQSTCNSICSSNWDCNADPLRRCRFCYQGKCSESLPAGEPGDAGTDSSKETP